MITRDDQIVTAWAERCSGPGWANRPIWVIVLNNGIYREECIQPSEQSATMQILFSVSGVIAEQMKTAVEIWRDKR